jgi:hypothetical protein
MTGCSYPPTYDGIGADEYMEWEIAIDNIFATRFMCPRRKVKNAVSVLRHSALSWWESLDPSDKPQTWNDMKLLMRETFVNPPPVLTSYAEVHHLEEESVVIPLAMTNLLQNNVYEIVLILTQDGCIVYAECVIALKIILDAPDGTPR